MSRNTRANQASKKKSISLSEQEFQEELPIRDIRASRKTTTFGALSRKYKAPFEIRSDSEGERFEKLKKLGVTDAYAICWKTMRKLGIHKKLEEDIYFLFLEKLIRIPHDQCEALTFEFFTTLAPTNDTSITFRLDGKEREYTMENLFQDFELNDEGMKELPEMEAFESSEVWNKASGKPSYDSHVSKLKEVRDIASIVLLKWYGHTFYGRHEHNKVAKSDLFLLQAMYHQTEPDKQVHLAYRLMALLRETPKVPKKKGFGWLVLFLARKDPEFDESKYSIQPPRMIDMDHLSIGGYVRKERVVGKYKYDNWVEAHPGEPIPLGLCASPRQEVEPRRAKEPVRRKDKHAAGTSTENQDVPEGVQWGQPDPNVAHGGCDFEEMQIRFMEDQRKMWKRMEYRQKRLHDRQRRHEEKLRDYFNAQGGPVYPSPTPSPEPPEFD